MSGYDVAVWHSTVAMTQAQARSFYHHLNADTVMFARDPQTEAFVVDLRRLIRIARPATNRLRAPTPRSITCSRETIPHQSLNP